MRDPVYVAHEANGARCLMIQYDQALDWRPVRDKVFQLVGDDWDSVILIPKTVWCKRWLDAAMKPDNSRY